MFKDTQSRYDNDENGNVYDANDDDDDDDSDDDGGDDLA